MVEAEEELPSAAVAALFEAEVALLGRVGLRKSGWKAGCFSRDHFSMGAGGGAAAGADCGVDRAGVADDGCGVADACAGTAGDAGGRRSETAA